MDAVDELVARSQIQQLVARYALAVDSKDLDTLASLFVDDLDEGIYGTGRLGVRNRFDHLLRSFHCSMHLVANHVIDLIDADHATGVVYCRVHHHRLDPEHWQDNAMAYFDIYERDEGHWRFRRRDVKTWYRQWWGHPEHDAQRVTPTREERGPRRGRLPDDFPTFDSFWASVPGPPASEINR